MKSLIANTDVKLTSAQVGKLAEYIVSTDLSRPVEGGYDRALFRMTHLGDLSDD